MPWADGTPCDGNYNERWCQRGECVQRNRYSLVKVDGGWGSYNK